MAHDPYLLLIGHNVDLCLLPPFLEVIQHQVEQGIILVLDHPFYPECRHADVDRDDLFRSVCWQERGFSGRDSFSGPVSPKHSEKFLCPFALALSIILHRLSRMVRLLISAGRCLENNRARRIDV